MPGVPTEEKKYSDGELQEAVQHAITRRDIKEIKDGLDTMKKSFEGLGIMMSQTYVTRTEFTPVKMIVYGMVGTVLLSFLGAMLYVVTGH